MKWREIGCVTFFFFSSRRRHTRLQGDWSSDVCSSDLPECRAAELVSAHASTRQRVRVRHSGAEWQFRNAARGEALRFLLAAQLSARESQTEEGRVGEKGETRGGPDHLKKKNKKKMIRM